MGRVGIAGRMALFVAALGDLYSRTSNCIGKNSAFTTGASMLMQRQWARLGSEGERLLRARMDIGFPIFLEELASDLCKVVKFGTGVTPVRAKNFQAALERSVESEGFEELGLAVGSPG